MAGVSSFGTQVQIGEADEDYVDLGCVTMAGVPGPDQQFSEDKCLGQDDRGIPSLPGFQDLGMMTLNLKYGQDAYGQLLDWQQEEPPRRVWVKLTFPKQYTAAGVLQAVAATCKFRAYIKQPSIEFPEDGGRVPINLTLKIDSMPDFTPGTSIS